jgi:hypothetical protein
VGSNPTPSANNFFCEKIVREKIKSNPVGSGLQTGPVHRNDAAGSCRLTEQIEYRFMAA